MLSMALAHDFSRYPSAKDEITWQLVGKFSISREVTSQRTCLTESWIILLTRKQTRLTSNLFLLAWIIFFTGGLRGRRLWGLSGLSPSFPFGALPLFFSLAVSSSCCLAIICSRWTLQGRRTVSQWAYHHLNSTSIKTKSMTCKNLANHSIRS